MTQAQIDAAEMRVLSGIIALVLDEQPGQSAAALDALRRRAAASRITAGALKNLFERLATPAPAPAPDRAAAGRAEADAHRLQLELDAAEIHAARLRAENAELQQQLAQTERIVRQLEARELARRRPGAMPSFTPPPRSLHIAGLLAGCLLTLVALGLAADQKAALVVKLSCLPVNNATSRLAHDGGFVVDLPHPAGGAGAMSREAADVYATLCR